MRVVKAIFAAALAISLAGCTIGNGKPKTAASVPAAPRPAPAASTAAAPPEHLSIPQTQEKLPPPQPVNPDALVEAPPDPPETAAPARSRNRTGPAAPTPKPAETGPPVGPTLPAVEPRPPIQEMVPPAEQKRLQESAQARKREIRQWLEARGRKHLTKPQQAEQPTVDRMRAFLKDSDAAEHRGDMREADALAERAQILLRELQNGQ